MTQLEEITKKFNIYREGKKGIVIFYDDAEKLTKLFPCAANKVNLLVKHHLITKVARGQYKVSDLPVHTSVIKLLIDEARHVVRDYNLKSYNKKVVKDDNKGLNEVLKTFNISDEMLVEHLLKSGNYKIQKKVIEWQDL